MMQGRKKYQRRQWVRDQEMYFGTKYLMNTVVGDNNRITFRCYDPGSDAIVPANYHLSITPFSDMYVSAMFGNGDTRQERAKAGEEVSLNFEVSTATDTQVTIYGANRIAALNDLSACYIAANDFSLATKLKKLVLGNSTPGYTNPRLISLQLGANKLLEELDIRNCSNLTGALNFSQCTNLKKLYAEGTALTSVTFATNGNVELVHLPNSINSLIMRNLNKLSDFQCNLDYLEILTLQGGTLDNYGLIQNTIDTLRTLNLYDVDWEVVDTILLNKMLNLYYSLVTGEIYVSGNIRNYEIVQYNEAWPNLTVTYNPNNVIPQHQITYVNADANHVVLYRAYVDQGSYPPDPYSEGLINMPLLAETDQYTYTFGTTNENDQYVYGSGWNTLDTVVSGPRTVYAVYTPHIKTYTVTWFIRSGVIAKQLTGVEYGSEVVYEDEEHGLPTRTDGEEFLTFYLFQGWNKSTAYITGNIDVYAIWDTAQQAPPDGMKMWKMSPAELYSIGRQDLQDQYWEDADYVDITLGHDFEFTNVEQIVIGKDVELEGVRKDKYISGGYYFDRTTAVTTDIQLLKENDEFTMAVDFQFNPSINNETIVSCNSGDTQDGFRIYYTNNYIYVQWGDKRQEIGYLRKRNIVVLRHPKGSRHLYIYSSYDASFTAGKTSYFSDQPAKSVLLRASNPITDEPLTFGGIHFQDNENQHQYLCNATLHWCKIWKKDLGEYVCKQLSIWPREKIRMEYWGKNKYLYTDESGALNPCKASFICNSSIGGTDRLYRRFNWDGTTKGTWGGWEESELRAFLNDRVYHALPYEWQSLIREVDIHSGYAELDEQTGNRTVYDYVSHDKLYLQSYWEIGYTSRDYEFEVGISTNPRISWFTSNLNRGRWPGIIRPRPDASNKFYTSYSDPVSVEALSSVEPGTIWLNQNNSYLYIYCEQEFIDQYGIQDSWKINVDPTFGCDGAWVYGHTYWLRTIHLTNNQVGYTSLSGWAGVGAGPTNAYAVIPSFSF